MNAQTQPAREETRAAKPKPSRDGFLVLGMHRSGTSAISGTLAKLGATPPKHLMGATEGNPRGHWESTELAGFHDQLLASAGSRWNDWREFNPDWYETPVAAEFKERAKALLASEFGDASAFVLKDPRICRFVRFWLEVFAEEGITPRPILPARLPLEVAQSLKTRDGSSLNQGLLLWLRHVLDAEAATRDIPRATLSWDAFLRDWRVEAARIAQQLDVHWPRLTDLVAVEIDDFLTVELKRETVSAEGARFHPDMHGWFNDAHEALLEIIRNPNSNSARDKLDELRRNFNTACALFGRNLAELELRADRLSNELEVLRDGNAKLNQELSNTNEFAELEAQVETLRESKTKLDQELILSQEKLKFIASELQTEHDARLRAEGTVAELEAQLQSEKATAQELVQRIAELNNSLAREFEASREKDTELEKALSKHDHIAGKLNRLRTQPIRSVLRFLFRRGV